MSDYVATCGEMRVSITAPDIPSARIVAWSRFRELAHDWWRNKMQVHEAVHTCSCGRVYDLKEWDALPSRGTQRFDDGGQPEYLDIRNCQCGTTMAREVYT